jgi:hypothetical protein
MTTTVTGNCQFHFVMVDSNYLGAVIVDDQRRAVETDARSKLIPGETLELPTALFSSGPVSHAFCYPTDAGGGRAAASMKSRRAILESPRAMRRSRRSRSRPGPQRSAWNERAANGRGAQKTLPPIR